MSNRTAQTTTKRLATYAATAAATVIAGGTANAVEVVHDIADVSGIGGTFDLQFNVISGATVSVGTGGATNNGSNWQLAGGPRLYAPNTSASAGFVNGASTNGGGFGTKGSVGFMYPDVLSVSNLVTPNLTFGGQTSYFGSNYGNYGWMDNAAWAGTTGVIGLQFKIGANQHYGWAQITVDGGTGEVTLHGFGYNDTPGADTHPVNTVVPEPSSLALLALGAVGLAARRKRKAVA